MGYIWKPCQSFSVNADNTVHTLKVSVQLLAVCINKINDDVYEKSTTYVQYMP